MTAPTMPGRPYGAPDVLVETRRAIAWDGVIAGSLVGLAVTICLSLAGAAMGLTLVDPWAKTPSVTALGFGAMIWLFIVNMLGMGIGGYIAGFLAKSGADVSVVARGAHLKAIQENGLTVELADGARIQPRPKASDDPATLGPQDAVLVTVKAPAQ